MSEAIVTTCREAALLYASKGWRVVPNHNPIFDGETVRCSCKEGANCPSIGKHPRITAWQINASTDPEQIKKWWAQWPDANVGIATGEGSNLVVVDIDRDKKTGEFTGQATLDKIRAIYGEDPETLEVTTGSGARQLYFLHPGFFKVTNTQSDVKVDHIDIRGDGGQVVAPPSLHYSGRRYKWANNKSPLDVPTWVLNWRMGKIDPTVDPNAEPEQETIVEIAVEGKGDQKIIEPATATSKMLSSLNGNKDKYVEAVVRAEVSRVSGAAEGSRNDSLNRAAFSLGTMVNDDFGLTETRVVDELTQAARKAGLGDSEIEKTISSGLAAGIAHPRDIEKLKAKSKPAKAEKKTEQDEEQGGRPVIQVTGMALEDVSAAAVDALKQAGEVFVSSGRLVRVSRIRLKKNTPEVVGIETLDDDSLLGMMVRSASYKRLNAKGEEMTTTPEMRVVKDILSRASAWDFPILSGVVTVPTLRADGSILDKPGYDEATGLIYQPERGFKWAGVSENPSPAEIEHAKDVLDELLCDFPFDTKASHDNAVALMVSMSARQMFDIAPMAGIDATQQSSGKSTLTDLCCIAGAGEAFPANGISKDDEETRKKITSNLLGGARIIIFDNAETVVGSDSLSRAITAKVWGDRLLGVNKGVSLSLDNTLFIVNGNNLSVTGDLATRVYPIRIAVDMARPQDRDSFKHVDIVGYAQERKGEVVAAVLTLIRAWVVAGMPEPSGVSWRFKSWVRVVGGVLHHAGYMDFLKNLRDFEERSDTQTPAWAAFIERLCEVYGKQTFTPTQLYLRIASDDSLRELMPAEMPPVTSDDDQKAKSTFNRRAPFELRRWMDRRLGGRGVKLVRVPDSHTKSFAWRVDCP